jgi:molybdopterin/thiamine biosynthesis adenylyltransferase
MVGVTWAPPGCASSNWRMTEHDVLSPRAPIGLAPRADDQTWQPTLFEPTDADGLAALLASGRVFAVHDRVEEQLRELVAADDPSRAWTPEEFAAATAAVRDGVATWRYGAWAFYPWSGRLVHVLPRAELRAVRTDRNRDKITRSEQERLLGRRIAVIGLSVGNSAALTCAMEGVGGAFRLADFDELGLSNLNRLRAGVADLGVPKTVLCARQMYELDPYLDVEIESGGVTEATIAEFFTGGHGPIDLVIEECDTPWVKLAARERARELGIPVVMDTNDRGLIDVERFDREPQRPLLHGRLGATRAADLAALDRAGLIRLMVDMVDGTQLSPAMAAALDQLGRTLTSWPQLASGTALGGALATDTARRILLGRPMPSGRYYVDLERLIGTPGGTP